LNDSKGSTGAENLSRQIQNMASMDKKPSNLAWENHRRAATIAKKQASS